MLDTSWFTKWLLILLSDISYQQLSYALQILGKKVIEINNTWLNKKCVLFFHWVDKNFNSSNFFLYRFLIEFKRFFLDYLRICLEVQKQRYHSPTTVTLLVVVIIFIICQSARCAANLADAILFLKLSPECQEDEDYVSMDGWSVILHTLSNILLAINRYTGFF